MEDFKVTPRTANLGNLKRILIIPERMVNGIRKPIIGKTVLGYRPIRIKSGGAMNVVECLPTMANFFEESNTGGYAQRLEVFLPGDSEVIRHTLDVEQETRFFVCFEDNDGWPRLMGENGNPAVVSWKFKTSNPKGREMIFSLQGISPAYVLPSMAVDDIISRVNDYGLIS